MELHHAKVFAAVLFTRSVGGRDKHDAEKRGRQDVQKVQTVASSAAQDRNKTLSRSRPLPVPLRLPSISFCSRPPPPSFRFLHQLFLVTIITFVFSLPLLVSVENGICVIRVSGHTCEDLRLQVLTQILSSQTSVMYNVCVRAHAHTHTHQAVRPFSAVVLPSGDPDR